VARPSPTTGASNVHHRDDRIRGRGLWIFAMPVLMDHAMDQRVKQDRLHDVRLSTSDVVLDAKSLAALRAVPGVRALETRTIYGTKILDEGRRSDVFLVGVPDWGRQEVNSISVDAGAAPRGAEVVTDRMNGRTGRFGGGIGARVQVADVRGRPHTVTVSGRGDTMMFSQIVADDRAVLYAPQSTVDGLAGASGVNSLELRVDDPRRADAVAAAVRARLLELKPSVTFTDLAEVRAAGSWPGQDVFNNFSTLLYVGALLALISALVLISNTMTTMVAEQTRQIAIMKAIGGRRRQIRRSYLRAALGLGVVGTLLGIAIGIPFANLALGFIGSRFFGVDPGWGVPGSAIIVSVVVGLGATLLASLPSLHRAARTSVRAGLESGVAAGGEGRGDRLLRRIRLPRTAQIGLRNVTRRRTRSLATTLQITLAVSVALGFLALGVTVADVTAQVWDSMRWDMIVSQRANVPLDQGAARLISSTKGVASSHPVLYNGLDVDGTQYESWGLPTTSRLYAPDIVAGRWLQRSDEASRRNVVVIGRALADKSGIHVGATVTVGTARGTAVLRVVGIDSRLMNNGTTLFLPLKTFQRLLGRHDTNAYWVVSSDRAQPKIDQLATALEDRLTAAGYPVGTEIRHVERAANLDGNRVLIAVLAMMGIPIVIIGMIGLLNAMMMNVIERTRDVGVLRCIGASSRTIRRIFRAEALAVAFTGAVIAIPVGWLIGRFLGWLVTTLFHFGSVPYTFPWIAAVIAVIATLAIAWLVVIAPLRRASRLAPGTALRYE